MQISNSLHTDVGAYFDHSVPGELSCYPGNAKLLHLHFLRFLYFVTPADVKGAL
jgi:hypothetical protein